MNRPLFSSASLPVSRAALFALVAGSGLLFLACSSSDSSANAPPVVDAFDLPDTATIGASGNYEIKGTVSAHDPDGLIAQILIEIPGYATPTMTINRQTLTSQPFVVQIDGRSPKGALTANAKVVDNDGASVSQTITVTLQ